MEACRTKEILQKEWGFLDPNDNKEFLATPNVKWCTAFYGSALNDSFSFMCHFDLPCSTRSLLDLERAMELRKLKGTEILCYLDGGYSFLYSSCTRKMVIKYVKKLNDSGWKINLVQKQYNIQFRPFCFRLGKGILYNIKTKQVSKYSMKPQIRTKGRKFCDVVFRIKAKLYEG